MPTIVDCRSCGRKLRVADDLLGRQVKCPTCGEQFTADDAPRSEAPPRLDLPDEPADRYERPVFDAEPDKVCPACRRSVPGRAMRCPHCNEPLADEPSPLWNGQRRDAEPDRSGLILTLGIVSLLVPVIGPVLGICAWVMAVRDMERMRRGQMDPRGMGQTQTGMICGIIGTVIEGLLSFFCVFPCLLGIIMPLAAPPPPRPVPMPAPVPAPAPRPVPTKRPFKALLVPKNADDRVLVSTCRVARVHRLDVTLGGQNLTTHIAKNMRLASCPFAT
jgi:predicted RNA-binding Zn-ribbon protein involved in translation (DUF1610 family)